MPQIRWADIGLKEMLSLANFCAIIFGVGMIWSSTTGDVANNKKEIADLKAEIARLRAQDTSIAVIKVDVQTVKENITELKGSMQRIEARVLDRLPAR